ncbi:DUF805 domain-containing protein [Hyphomicrobium sp.]|uniref:DUF805 domain-containing protein n=1 Tax=Hyphomicrobium sp. TaxID=82 RepID=UPI002FE42B4B
MTGYLIDLLFSLKGRASRREWLLGTAAISAAALVGIGLFNDGSFDESMNAAPEIPTMAAVLWALICLYAFTALSAKRLNATGRRRWTVAALAAPVFLLICGWGSGYFLAPFASDPDTLVFWTLVAAAIPALLACIRSPETA